MGDEARKDFAAAYGRMVKRVGGRAGTIGNRPIAAHWPFVGTAYRGVLVLGGALDRWDAVETPARWFAPQLVSADGRRRALEGSQRWATSRPEPISEVAERPNRKGKPFWTLSKAVVKALEPDGPDPWYSRYAWWNLYPFGWEDPGGGPTGPLLEAQRPLVLPVLRAALRWLRPTRVVFLAGKDVWGTDSGHLGLQAALTPRSRPLLAAGWFEGSAWVATYHPNARHRAVTRPAFADAVLNAFRDVEASRPPYSEAIVERDRGVEPSPG